MAGARSCPHLNQIECHTRQQQDELVAYCHSHGIVCTAYSPISGSDLEEPILQRLATAHGVSPGDIVLRWLKQRSIVAIPKVRYCGSCMLSSLNSISCFDFSLSMDGAD